MRAQATLEFLILAALLLIMFLALLQVYFTRLNAGQDFQERLGAQRLVDDAGRHIDRVLQSGNSSRIQFQLPTLLPTGQAYTLVRIGRRLEIAWESKTVNSLLLTQAVSGSFTPGTLYNITNNNGGILIVPA